MCRPTTIATKAETGHNWKSEITREEQCGFIQRTTYDRVTYYAETCPRRLFPLRPSRWKSPNLALACAGQHKMDLMAPCRGSRWTDQRGSRGPQHIQVSSDVPPRSCSAPESLTSGSVRTHELDKLADAFPVRENPDCMGLCNLFNIHQSNRLLFYNRRREGTNSITIISPARESRVIGLHSGYQAQAWYLIRSY